jgi:hypothetical protein
MKKSGTFRHGLNHHPLYSVWCGMKSRCKTTKSYGDNWQGRGGVVCEEWQGVIPFFCWAVTHGYQKGLTLDRIDNDGNYEPLNCRFTTWSVQNSNKRKYRSMPRNNENNLSDEKKLPTSTKYLSKDLRILNISHIFAEVKHKNNAMKHIEETKIRPHSFRRGYDQLKRGEYLEVRREIMDALNITTEMSFYNRLNGKVIPKVTEAEVIEGIFAKRGILEVWGR